VIAEKYGLLRRLIFVAKRGLNAWPRGPVIEPKTLSVAIRKRHCFRRGALRALRDLRSTWLRNESLFRHNLLSILEASGKNITDALSRICPDHRDPEI